MDYSKLKIELLKELRGKRSKISLSRDMGFSYNQVYKWEKGITNISWEEFCHLCEACGRSLESNVFVHLGRGAYYSKNMDFTCGGEIAKLLIGKRQLKEVAKIIGTKDYIISRWLHKKTYPKLEDILALMQLEVGALYGILSCIVDIENLAFLRDESDYKIKREFINNKHPYLSGVISVLFLKKYKELEKHVDGFIANYIGISLKEEKAALNDLEEIEAIKFENNKYHLQGKSLELQGESNMAYWSRRYFKLLEERYADGNRMVDDSWICAIPNSSVEEINILISKFSQDVSTIIDNSPYESDQVSFILVDQIDLFPRD